MRYVSLIFMLFLCSNCALGYTLTTYEPPVAANQDTYNSYPKISQLESILLNKTYENENLELRLKRLEKKACAKVYSGSDLAWRVDNIMSHIDQSTLYNIPSKELASIEKRVLGKSYTRDNLDNRLSRLEYQMLGAAQSGKPDQRYQTLLTASNHYTNMSLPASNFDTTTITSTGGTGGVKGMLQNVFGSMFNGGYVTGYTPPIAPYGYSQPYGFNPYYNNFRTNLPTGFNTYSPYGYGLNYGNGGITRSIRTRTGWYNSHQNIGSGCGVRILD